MKASISMSLKKLGYNIVRLGPGWPGRSEMYAYRGDYKSPDAVYSGRRKALVYRELDREDRRKLGSLAAGLNLSFAYPLKIDDDRVVYCLDGEVSITSRRRNVALHELLLDKK